MGHVTAKSLAKQADMVEKYQSGLSLADIGELYGVSRQAIHKVIKKAGVTRENAGANKRAKLKKKKALDDKHQEYCVNYGCTRGEYLAINKCLDARGVKPIRRYEKQKSNAKRRGIEWRFVFKGWWDVWEKSGKWLDRGKESGKYVMSRHHDTGPYSPENVKIIRCTENILEYFEREYGKEYALTLFYRSLTEI